MSKKRILVVSIISLLLLFLISGIALLIFILRREPGVFTSGTRDQEPIKGPDVGEWGNDMDNTFRSLTISPTDPDIVYIGNEGNGIFRTVDGGKSWEWLRNGLKYAKKYYPEVYDIAIDEQDENVVLAATTDGPNPIYSDEYTFPITAGVYRSDNKGDTWTQYFTGLPNSAIVSIVKIPEKKDTFIIGLDGLESTRDNFKHLECYGGLYISNDSGRSWTALPIPEQGIQNRYPKLIVRGINKSIIYTTGVKWTENPGSSHSTPDFEGAIGLIKSSDLGQTWTRINPSHEFVLYFDVSLDGNTVYASSMEEGKLYISEDQGQNWRNINFGTGPIKISPDDKEKVLFGLGSELHITEDGFQSHTRVLSVDQHINDIEYFEGDSDIVYLSTSGIQVYKSVDGGDTFKKVGDLRKYIDEF